MRARAPPPLTLLYCSPQNLPAPGPRQPRPGLFYRSSCRSLKVFVASHGSALSPPVLDRLLAASTLETNDLREEEEQKTTKDTAGLFPAALSPASGWGL